MIIAELILRLAIPIVKIIVNAVSDDYDKEKELRHMLDIEKAAANARFRKLLKKK